MKYGISYIRCIHEYIGALDDRGRSLDVTRGQGDVQASLGTAVPGAGTTGAVPTPRSSSEDDLAAELEAAGASLQAQGGVPDSGAEILDSGT